MADPLPPALTASEWAEKRFWPQGSYIGPTIGFEGDRMVICDDDYYTGFTHYLDRRHAVAALALWGQPFGFTRADSDLLRSLGERLVADGIVEQPPRWMLDLAARIAALLHPKEASDAKAE